MSQSDISARPLCVALTQTRVLRFTGADATAFLHGQLTSDVAGLTPERHQYSGYCTPKGRLLASLLIWRDADALFLELPASLAEAIRKRLTMYVLRSKVQIADVTDELVRFGVAHASASEVTATGLPAPEAGQTARQDDVVVLGLPGPRWEVIAPAAQRDALTARLNPVGDEAAWELATLTAGIPVIVPATQEAFVPQMVNFDAIGAVSFNKGCYPGQEIVARMHYLGRLKQRMFLARCSGAPAAPGEKLYGVDMGDQACGTVVNAIATGDSVTLLAVVQTSSREAGPVRLGTPAGAELQFLALPYRLDEPR